MNIVIVPFHDWRKILLEGSRTRDAHFIEAFKSREDICVIINRPTTLLEIQLKRKRGLIKGKLILSNGGCKLYEYSKNTYLIDYVSVDVVGQALKNYNWFISEYGSDKYVNFINQSLAHLGIKENYSLLNQNIFASRLSSKLKPKVSIFDAWDNFAKFSVYSKLKEEIIENYMQFSKTCDFWITNSVDNISEFKTQYGVENIHLIANGVDVSRFVGASKSIPDDLSQIKKPIVGFGGKISHLLDVELINKTTEASPDVSFVFVGQILDKTIFNEIIKRENVHYLGDKHYDVYPDYVKNFDICTVPYVIDEKKKSGANTIKVYEYLATQKKVVGTLSNGLENLLDHVYIINNASEFSDALKSCENHKNKIDLKTHSWETKTQQIIELILS
ncbi:hypothetical protein [uncultured Psychroserpens sp.]|uniref:hypothetical protein n=1 Tax=uncultured Psychroserpens sp. TaxID=255436 RepID=UPI00262A880E|nr:hypothetical protein [uncultured Psychroserpens sp.]